MGQAEIIFPMNGRTQECAMGVAVRLRPSFMTSRRGLKSQRQPAADRNTSQTIQLMRFFLPHHHPTLLFDFLWDSVNLRMRMMLFPRIPSQVWRYHRQHPHLQIQRRTGSLDCHSPPSRRSGQETRKINCSGHPYPL